MAADPVTVTIVAVGIIAGLLGLLLVVTAWARIKTGPGGDLTREVLYLKGNDLAKPFGVLVSGLGIVVLENAYIMVVQFGFLDETRWLVFLMMALQAVVLLVGGVMLYRTLRGFAPAARTSKRREILELLAQAIQSRGRALRRAKGP